MKNVFEAKKIVFDTKSIFFDKKKMQTAVGTVFPAIETIASTIEAIVFLIKITTCGTKIYSQKRNPFSTHLRSVSLLRRSRQHLCNPNKSTQKGSARCLLPLPNIYGFQLR
jgi:hypothetical protein